MSGPEHYVRAERLVEDLRRAKASISQAVSPETAMIALAEAQVHATLALAAATALPEPSRAATRATVPEWDAWHTAAGVQPESYDVKGSAS
ncbi:hypothetical protein GCM10011583_18550 [Streptomyces camponoticapitis]|uniref:Uncharacterized protein n=1 Tax=Streptomyces camponoticapitis TaxID=1616125 RepID=A0ABQ2E3Z6_9ACTN|nr:hypothetical protein [Streptomyces camponoticapitis]GGJ87293.1 hypothetical protein GCM10011583_18550 [Streptomyces camponoticapitis]